MHDVTELKSLADAEVRLLGLWAAAAGIPLERLLELLDAKARMEPGEERALLDAIHMLRRAARRERRRCAH